jgi:hypothetical protein
VLAGESCALALQGIRMTIQGWCERLFLTLIRALALCVFLGALSANISAAYAQPAGIPIAGQAGENPPQGYIDPATPF